MKIVTKSILSLLLCFYLSNAAADQAILAGGCFWCMESDFEHLQGVSDVVSGFTGGTLKNPTYNGNHDGYLESVLITFDPKKVSYEQLMRYYWRHIDPFDAGGQFCDRGHSYLSAVFVANAAQRKIAQQTKQEVIDKFPGKKVVTPILDATTFYPIKGDESYHQDFYKKSPIRYKFYRYRCGRDQRVEEIWGKPASH